MEDIPSLLQRLPSRASGEEIFLSGLPRNNELRKSCSIVMQDNSFQLSGTPKKTDDALGRSYRVLQKGFRAPGDVLEPHAESDNEGSGNESNVSVCGSENTSKSSGTRFPKFSAPPLPRKTFSFDAMKQRGQLHQQSADLFENFSPVQKERQYWDPVLPDAFSMGPVCLVPVEAPELGQRDADQLKALHPNTFGAPCLEVQPDRGLLIYTHSILTELSFNSVNLSTL